MDLSELRLSYTQAGLLESEVDPDPFRQFARWMDEAIAMQLLEPNAMTLATADSSGQPSARTVLLKGFDERGFIFYTNYESRKSQDLAENPKASLLFYWGPFERQVRIVGTAARISAAESDLYFASRPAGHQLGAWASRQSATISSREALEENLAEAVHRFGSGPIPRPPFWGGFRVAPDTIEFWQGRLNRLHDRLEYAAGDGGWKMRRLSP